MSRNLALLGMSGSGKTTVARAVGARLGRRVVDTDDEIAGWTGRAVPVIFAQRGEAGFRDLERQVVERLATLTDLVIALGGGAVLRDDNVASLLLTGVLVELRVPQPVLVDRLRTEAGGRPLLAGDMEQQLATMVAARGPRYAEVADVSIDAARPVDDVADDIVAWALDQSDVLTPSEHELVMR